MKGFKLLFKNNLKNTIKNKIQFVSLVILVFLTSFIFTIIEVSKQRVENNYNNFISEKLSNKHDFVVNFDNTTYIKNSNKNKNQFKKITDNSIRQNIILEFIKQKLKNKNECFIYDYIEARTFSLGNNKIIKAITLNPYQKIDKFIVINGMPLNFYKKYLFSIKKETMHWIYLTPEFSRKNNIKINNIIRLQPDIYGTTIKVIDSEIKKVDLTQYEKEDINRWLPKSKYSNENWFRVVGFGQSADYITPIIDKLHPIPNIRNEGIAYLDPRLFGLFEEIIEYENNKKYSIIKLDITKQILIPESQSDREIYYVGKFQKTNINKIKNTYSKILNSYLNTEKGKYIGLHGYYIKTLLTDLPIVTFYNDNHYEYSQRITYFTSALNIFIKCSYILITILLIISFFMLILVVQRQIEATGPQNGLLRALGYGYSTLILSYISYPLLIALIGGIIGYSMGISGQFIVKYIFGSFFNLPYGNFVFAPLALIICVLFIFTLLTFVTIISGVIMMILKTPLQLIIKEKKISNNIFKKIIYKVFILNKTFDARFQIIQLSNSIGKIIWVSLTMIISTIIITMSTIIPIILQNNINYSYKGNKYKTLVEYNNPIYNLPTTFLKTYDPSQKPWNNKKSLFNKTNMTRDVNQYINDFETGQINSENFSPTYKAEDMRSLLYRNISKEFLKSNKLTSNNFNLSKSICTTSWKDYNDFGLNILTKSTIKQYLRTTETAWENIDILEKYRLFYWKYKETIGLNIKNLNYFDLNGNLNLKNNFKKDIFTQNDYNNDFGQKNTIIILNNNHFRPSLEQQLSKPFYIVLNSIMGNNFNEYFKKPIYNLYNWIYVYFINNINQCFIQGIYSRSPQTVRIKMQKAFNNNNNNFNLTFGVIPFNPLTDDIGTMINAELNNIKFKIYGIDKSFKNQKLINKNNENLNEKIFIENNNIILNETLAKILNVKIGNEISPFIIRKALISNEQKNITSDQILNSWDESEISGDINILNLSKNQKRVGKLMFNGDNKYKNDVLKDKNNKYVLESKIDTFDPNFTKPTILNNKIVNSNYQINNQKYNKKFKIVGINNQYGFPKAWINENIAQEILGYNKIRNNLLQLFLNEWTNSFIKNNIKLKLSKKNSLILLEKFIKNYSNKSNKNNLWFNFIKYWKINKSEVNWINVFKNEYPIFNYKISNNSKIDDIESGLGTSQLFGDYSFYGLNGGIKNKISYSPYANNIFINLISINEAKKILKNISKAINGIILFIISISFILSFIIIILTSNIVIAENQIIIATMKILGYLNRYITKLVIGMYVPIIIIMTIIGFNLGWLLLIISNIFLIKIGIVLPIFMHIIIPFIAIGSGLFLYFVAYLISWFNMNRINPIIAIVNAD